MTLEEHYIELCETPSDIYEHLPVFVDLVKQLDAKHVIELGSRSGVSTVAWLYALEQTGGRLTSIDLDPAPPIGMHGHWTHIQGDDLTPSIVETLPEADIVFIDTSHHYRQTLMELHTYRWLVKPGGVIVCHDTELPIPEGQPAGDPVHPVRTAIDEFTAECGFDWINYPNCWGLGVIKVV